MDTSADNQEVTLLPEPLFAQAIDLALAERIAASTPGDPLIKRTMQALFKDLPLFLKMNASDWDFDGQQLYFCKKHYIPEAAHTDLI